MYKDHTRWVRYWAFTRRTAKVLTGRPSVVPGKDYALTEIVHCKSRHETGVRDSIEECASRYLDKVLSVCAAGLIVCLGDIAFGVLNKRYDLVKITERIFEFPQGPRRAVLRLPHSNAYGMKRVDKLLSCGELERTREYL